MNTFLVRETLPATFVPFHFWYPIGDHWKATSPMVEHNVGIYIFFVGPTCSEQQHVSLLFGPLYCASAKSFTAHYISKWLKVEIVMWIIRWWKKKHGLKPIENNVTAKHFFFSYVLFSMEIGEWRRVILSYIGI